MTSLAKTTSIDAMNVAASLRRRGLAQDSLDGIDGALAERCAR